MRLPSGIAGLCLVIGAIRIAHVVKFVCVASGITAPKWPVAAGFLLFLGDFPTYARMTDARHPTDKTDVQFQVILAFFLPKCRKALRIYQIMEGDRL